MDTTVVGYEWSALRSLIAKSLEQGSEVVLKILILKKISLKCVCVIFLVLAIEFLCRTTRTRVTLAVQSGAAILGGDQADLGPELLQENDESCNAHSCMMPEL